MWYRASVSPEGGKGKGAEIYGSQCHSRNQGTVTAVPWPKSRGQHENSHGKGTHLKNASKGGLRDSMPYFFLIHNQVNATYKSNLFSSSTGAYVPFT